MSKCPKKKNANRKPAAATKGAGACAETPAAVVPELESAILQLRGRRSMVLARQLKPEGSIPAERCEKLVAAAHEAYVRELLEGGHTGSAKDHARSFVGKEPGLCRYWALSLQVRLGLVDDLETLAVDPVWCERLRLELVDPADLVDCPVAAMATDARALSDAWQAADSGELQAARALIAGIGRRSLLVDWRLFVQASAAAREGNAGEMEAALNRIMPGTPAAHLGYALRACLQQDREALAGTELASQLALPPPELVDHAKSLSDALLKSGRKSAVLNKSLKTLLVALLQAKRPAAAHLVLASACKGRLDTTLLDAANDAGLSVSHVHLCGVMINVPKDEWCSEYDKLLRESGWSPRERALLRLEQARDERQALEADAYDLDWPEEDEDEEGLESIQAWCREAAGCWPSLREIYATWRWAERLGKTHHAETAETRAFPSDPQAWEHLIRRLAKLAKFKECGKALDSLAALPGTNEACSHLRGHIAFQMVCDAFNRQLPFTTLQTLAGACKVADPIERMGIAARLWLRAKGNAQKRQFGAGMADLGHPWLAAVQCFQLSDEAITVSKLPSKLKQALQAKPAEVVDDFRFLAGYADRSRINWQNDSLLKPLLSALADPGLPPSAAHGALYDLLLGSWHDVRVDMITEFRSEVIAITARLLDSGEFPSPVAIGAMAFRALLYDAAEPKRNESFESIAVRLLRAARQLATDSQTRSIVREVGDRTGLIKHSAVVADDTDEALALWRQQRDIRNDNQFWDHFYEGRESSGFIEAMRQSSGIGDSISDVIARLFGAQDDDDWDASDDDDEEAFEPPVARTPWPGKRGKTSSRDRIDLNKCFPNSEMEFEILISKLEFTGDIDDKNILYDKIHASCLSEKAKDRLSRRLEGSLGDNGGCPF